VVGLQPACSSSARSCCITPWPVSSSVAMAITKREAKLRLIRGRPEAPDLTGTLPKKSPGVSRGGVV